MGGVKHGHARNGRRTPEYKAWDGLKTRCNNPRHKLYPYYGGRGITVCEAWNRPDGFARFLADMGPRPAKNYTLERIDNSQGYNPTNCRWATWRQQTRNTRRNRLITINGNTKPLCDWAEVFGIHHQNVRNRIYMGWDPVRALVTPVKHRPPYSVQAKKDLPAKLLPTKFLTTQQAADVLGTSESCLGQWRHRKIGPPFYRFRALIRYDRDELMAWLETCRVDPKAVAP